MDINAIKSRLAEDDVAKLSDADAADMLNALMVDVRKSRFVTKTSVYAAVGFSAGLTLMGTFKALAENADQATALQFTEILDLLRVSGDGLDISLDETRAVMDSLVSGGILSLSDANKLKALGVEAQPWPIANGCGRLLDFADIRKARES